MNYESSLPFGALREGGNKGEEEKGCKIMEINKKTRIRIFLEQVLGWFCIFAGILGLLLPFFQGLLLIAIGLVILSAVYPKLRYFIQEKFKQAENWNPRISKFVKSLEKVYKKVVSVFDVKNQ